MFGLTVTSQGNAAEGMGDCFLLLKLEVETV